MAQAYDSDEELIGLSNFLLNPNDCLDSVEMIPTQQLFKKK